MSIRTFLSHIFRESYSHDEQLLPVLTLVDIELEKRPKEKQYAVFDFDNTSVIHDIQQALVAYLCRHNLIRHRALLPREYSITQNDSYHRDVFHYYWDMIERGITFDAYLFSHRMLVGFHTNEIRSLFTHIVREQGTVLGSEYLFDRQITVGFQKSARVIRLMKLLQKRNIEICIVSASPEVLVRESMRHHGIPTKTCVGTKLHLENGVFIDKIVMPAPVEAGKIVCVKKIFGENRIPIVGVGDTMNDCSMLQFVSIPVAVDRQNPLADEARKNGWSIITHE